MPDTPLTFTINGEDRTPSRLGLALAAVLGVPAFCVFLFAFALVTACVLLAIPSIYVGWRLSEKRDA